MPNWAEVTYKCIGEEKELKELFSVLETLEGGKAPIVRNGFGNLFLGCVLSQMGYDWEEYDCRGEVTGYRLEDDMLVIDQWVAWEEKEDFRECIEEHYPSVEVYYREIESGNELYRTNSLEYFPEEYVLESINGTELFEELEGVAEALRDIIGKEVKASLPAIRKAIREYNDSDPEEYASLHFVEEV